MSCWSSPAAINAKSRIVIGEPTGLSDLPLSDAVSGRKLCKRIAIARPEPGATAAVFSDRDGEPVAPDPREILHVPIMLPV